MNIKENKENQYREALQALVNKLDEISKHSSFVGVFQNAWIHGQVYNGPTWEPELKNARKTLEET